MKQHFVFIAVSLVLSFYVWKFACQLGEYRQIPDSKKSRLELADLNGLWQISTDIAQGGKPGNCFMVISDGYLIRSSFLPGLSTPSVIGKCSGSGDEFLAHCRTDLDSTTHQSEWHIFLEGDSLLVHKVRQDTQGPRPIQERPEIWLRTSFVTR